MTRAVQTVDIEGADDRASRDLRITQLRTSGTVTEPLTVAQLKVFARVDDDVDDDTQTIQDCITDAREWIENFCGVCYLGQSWQFKLDAFPDGEAPIYIPKAPIQTVSSITYVDENGTTQTMPAADYEYDTSPDPASWPPRISLAYGASWPSARQKMNAVTISAALGWITATIPGPMLRALKMLAAYYYDQRRTAEFLQGAEIREIPYATMALLQDFRIRRFG